MTVQEILKLENIPASAPLPDSGFKNRSRIVLSSEDHNFDPRKQFMPVENVHGAWQLESESPVWHGVPVQTMAIIEPGSLRGSDAASGDAFRPEWQPHIYHPKAAVYVDDRPTLRRKSGAKVRLDYVYPPDDRLIFVPEGYPWTCIGRVFAQGDGGSVSTGTAALVGSRVILTSSHLIPWDARRISIKFVPGYINGLSFGTGVSEAYVTAGRGYRNGKQGHDLVVCRLDVPLGNRLGYFGYRVYDDDWEDDPRWTLVGYPGVWRGIDIGGEFPTRQFGISVEDDDDDGDALAGC